MSPRKVIKNDILKNYLISDLKLVNLPVDFELEFKGYSKCYYGRYFTLQHKIVVYILDEFGNILPYHEILDTVIHEAIHHYQHTHQEGFVRYRGVMHDRVFHKLYNESVSKLRSMEVIPSA